MDVNIFSESEILVFVVAVCISIISILCFCHEDCYIIVGRAKEFCNCIIEGSIKNYAYNCYEKTGWYNDYSVTINIINATLMIPVVMVERVRGRSISIISSSVWYKCILLAVNFLICFVGNDILKSKGFEKRKRRLFSYLYILSPVVQIASIAQGQIICFSLLFMLLAYREILKKHNKLGVTFAVISIAIKPLALFFFAPFIIDFILGKFNNLVICICMGMPWLLFEKVIKRWVTDWDKHTWILDRKFVERLFDVMMGNKPIFLLVAVITGIACIYCVISDGVNERRSLILSLVLFLDFEMFIFWHPQWLQYAAVFISAIFICIDYSNFKIKVLLFSLLLAFNVSFIIETMALFESFDLSNGNNLLRLSALNRAINISRAYEGKTIIAGLDALFLNTRKLFASILSAVIAAIIYISGSTWLKESKNAGNAKESAEKYSNAMLLLYVMPVLLWQIFMIILYLRNTL